MSAKNKICVYAICKNELKFVDAWLENMSEADYIVILDTGSTDGTYEKLKNDKRVTRVEQKIVDPWRFDVARNESMKLVPDDADILVCTDFDELFNTGWAQVVKENWDPEYNRMLYTYAWSHNSIGEPTDIFKYDKIHTKDFHWLFPVHEVLYPNDGITASFIDLGESVYLQHWQDTTKERINYFPLLELAIEENPENAYEHMLLAQEYFLKNDIENALKYYLETLHLEDIDSEDKRWVLLECLERCGDCYQNLNNFDEAIWYYQEFIKEDSTYREPYLALARIYLTMKMPTLAKGMLDIARDYTNRKYVWVEQTNSWVSELEELFAFTYYELKDYDLALENAKIALSHDPDNINLLKLFKTILTVKLEQADKKIADLEKVEY